MPRATLDPMGCASLLSRRACLALLGSAAWTGPRAAASVQRDEVWTDAARARAVPVRLRLPAAARGAPLVVLSHGLGGSREGGDVWGRAWADAGFVVVHVQHAGSDTPAVFAPGAELREAMAPEQLVERVADLRFLLDEAQRRQRAGDADWAAADLANVGAAGHSFGALTVQALAGQRYGTREIGDARWRAFIAFSPSLPRRGDATAAFADMTRPFLAVTGSDDGSPFGEPRDGQARRRVHDHLPAGQRAMLWLLGADHGTFAGNGERALRARRGPLGRSETALRQEAAHHALVARVTTLWWRWRLRGDEAAKDALRRLDGLAAGDEWRLD